MTPPKTTVLLSAYKGARWLTEQLDSIRLQRNVNVRLLVRDDGSPDEGATLNLLHGYRKLHPDFDMAVIEGKNVGFSESFSILIAEALKDPQAAYFAFSDQDDVWLEDKLQAALLQLQELEESAGCTLPLAYCSNTQLVDTSLNPLRISWESKDVIIHKSRAIVQSYASGCTMLFNRKAATLYTSHLKPGLRYHDYLLYLICVFFGNIVFDPTPHILYRQHTNNQVGKPSVWARWKKRLTLNWDKTNATATQADYFLRAFGDMLTQEDTDLLKKVANYRRNLSTRLSLAFDKRFRRSGFEANLVQTIKILAGRL